MRRTNGVDLSMFPRIIFNVVHSSVRRGLAEDGTRFQIPFQAAKKFGPIDLDVEFGPLISSAGPGELIYGLVGGHGSVEGHIDHGRSACDFAHELHSRSRDPEFRFSPQTQRARDLACLVRPRRALRRGRAARASSATAESSCFTKRDQCVLEAGFCGKIRIKATITTRSASEAV